MHRRIAAQHPPKAKNASSWRRWPAWFIGLVLAMASVFGLAPAANAANQVVIDNVQFVNSESKDPINGFDDGSSQYLQIDMSVPGPGPATAPVTGTIHLDERLKATPTKVDIIGDDGSVVGKCLVSENKLECSLDDDYVEAHPYDLEGSVYFWTWVGAGNDQTEDLEFTVGDTVTRPVEVGPNPGNEQCETDCEYTGTPSSKLHYWKYDEQTAETSLEWVVRPPAGPDGMTVGASVVVRETIDLNQFEILPGYPKIIPYDYTFFNNEGFPQLNYDGEALSPEEFDTSDDRLTVTFTVTKGELENPSPDQNPLKGRIYDVIWKVVPIDGWVSNHTYENKAYITVTTPGGSEGGEVSDNAQYQGGGGNVIGSNVGRVYISKLVEGDNPPPAGTSYLVDWKGCDTANAYNPATHDGADCRGGQVSVAASADPTKPAYARIGDFPIGWRVIATEQTPAGIPPNTEWQSEWEWVDREGNPIGNGGPTAQLDVTVGGSEVALGQAGYFKVTNTFTRQQTEGQFGARKAITNNAGFDLENEQYTLRYSYPQSVDYEAGVAGFPAGSGTLTLPGNGDARYSDTLPVGAQLTFEEVALPDVPGVDWGTPSISPASLTITEESLAAPVVVTVTNDATPSAVDAGYFVVQKTLENPDDVTIPNLADLYFTLNYDVQAPGEGVSAESIEVPADGEKVSSPEYPVGTVITVTGEDLSDLPNIPNAAWGSPSWSPSGPFTIGSEPSDVQTVALTNSVRSTVGYFQANKTFGDTGGLELDHLDYTLNYSYPAGDGFAAGSGSLVVEGDGSLSTSGPLPIGAVLTFSEGDLPELEGVIWGTPEIVPSELTITSGTNEVSVVVTNEATQAPSPGKFSAQKVIEYPNGDDELVDLDGAFFTLQYWYTEPEQAEMGPFTMQLGAAGSPVLSDDIPAGAEVRVEEAIDFPDVPGATWDQSAVSVTPSSFTMDETVAEIHVTVSNTIRKDLGNFTLAKRINNPDEVDIDEVPFFTVQYDYFYGTEFQGTESIVIPANGNEVASISHPLGTTITLKEVPPAEVGNATWDAPVFSENTFEVTAGGASAQLVTVTNSISQDPGGFSAFKDIVNDDGLHLDWFTFDITYEYEFNGVVTGPFTLTLDANGDREASVEIPIGAEVRILGEGAPTEVGNAQWEDAVIAPTRFLIPEEGAAPVTVRVENTISVDRGVFAAHKLLVNDEGIDLPESLPGSPFPYQFVLYYHYTAVEGIPAGDGFMYLDRDGSVATSGEIPYGSTVTVMEVDPPELGGTTWRDPVLSEESFVMDASTDKLLELEVENSIYRELMPFWATKTLGLEDGLTLPDDIEGFELEYTYTYPWVGESADPAERGGTGSLFLTFDPETNEPNTAVSIDLPHGTEVSVREVLPAVPNGQFWQDPVITNQQFTIDAAAFEYVTVEAENTLSKVPPTPPVPPILVVTGMLAPWFALFAALLLLAAGAYVMSRRRASAQQSHLE